MYHFTDTEGKAIVSDWNGSQACFEKRFCGMSHEIMDQFLCCLNEQPADSESNLNEWKRKQLEVCEAYLLPRCCDDGLECCPDYEYPSSDIFEVYKKTSCKCTCDKEKKCCNMCHEEPEAQGKLCPCDPYKDANRCCPQGFHYSERFSDFRVAGKEATFTNGCCQNGDPTCCDPKKDKSCNKCGCVGPENADSMARFNAMKCCQQLYASQFGVDCEKWGKT